MYISIYIAIASYQLSKSPAALRGRK